MIVELGRGILRQELQLELQGSVISSKASANIGRAKLGLERKERVQVLTEFQL